MNKEDYNIHFLDLLRVSSEIMYVEYLIKCLASNQHSTNGRMVGKVIIVVVQYKCVYQPGKVLMKL